MNALEPSIPKQHPGPAGDGPLPAMIGRDIPPVLRAGLLDPTLWRDGLEKYARTTHLAVALTDEGGRLLGGCINAQPTWGRLHSRQAEAADGCPFGLESREPCTCVADALARKGGRAVVVRDRTGLVHFALPLFLGDCPLGALVAGQVFDQYPEQLPLDRGAKKLGLSPASVWQLARLEHPVKQATLHVYAELLETLGQTFLHTRYHMLRETERLAEMTRLRDCAVAEVIERQRVEKGQQFLLEASAEFVSRDEETTLMHLARRTVPFLADFCFFDVVQLDGTIRRVGWAHADPDKHRWFDQVGQFVPPSGPNDHPVAKVLITGEAEFIPEVTDDWMQRVATSPQHLAFMRALELRSVIVLPMIVHQRNLGALTFCYDAASGRHYTAAELVLAEDLARRIAMVVENAELYRELREADRHKDEFLAVLGHELRSPLAAIRQAMQILRLTELADPEPRWATGVVERQVQQLSRLVDDLLDISRVSQGKINLRNEPVDLKTVVARAVEMSRPLIDARRHDLKLSLPEEAVEVEGDISRLAQVVSNLLNNSAKYTEDGGRIELVLEADGSRAILRVRDTGVGIAPAMLPRIFDLFIQVPGGENRSAGGLGIGLSLVRNMIELHGGSVQATSAGLGQGSEFVVRLPLLQKARPQSPTEEEKLSLKARRILVVDDNKDVADSMATLLRVFGHEVRTAYDGPAALDLARMQPPEIVLCDLEMPPGMSGLEVAHRLRQDVGLHNAILVAVSGHSQEEDRRYTQEAGFNAHLIKPVDLDALKSLLARASSLFPDAIAANQPAPSAP
jgi:signal transduction histidine kinase/ActR/RegA family two-component response regulator